MTDPIDPLLQALARRKIIHLPDTEEAKPDRLSEYASLIKQWEAEEKAKREAEAEEALKAQPTTTVVGQAIALNGAGVLNAAAAGLGTGATVNGSLSSIIYSEIQRGRHE